MLPTNSHLSLKLLKKIITNGNFFGVAVLDDYFITGGELEETLYGG